MGLTSKPTPQPTPLDDDPLDCLRLIRSRRVGAVTWHRLVGEHGSAGRALAALPDIARAAGVADYEPCPVAVARSEMVAGAKAGAKMIVFGGAGYPADLAEIPDAPPVLWVRGDAGLLLQPMVAMVGARNASSLGLRTARRLAAGVGEAGLITVSGLARGIDTEVHLASLPMGSIAVMAGGVDVAYPEENADLLARMAKDGCVLSEQPMGLIPQARHFPLRNRIVAGLSRGVVVVEAAQRSGSLITARLAADQGREVMAIPGHPLDARASGCNQLIRDGAWLVRDAADVVQALSAEHRPFVAPDAPGPADDFAPAPPVSPPPARPVMTRPPVASPAAAPDPQHGQPVHAAQPTAPKAPPPPASGQTVMPILAGMAGSGALSDAPDPPRRPLAEVARLHGHILDRLAPSPMAEDQLIRDLDLPSATVTAEILALELEGFINRAAGGLLALSDRAAPLSARRAPKRVGQA